jgi:hypothetical protein
MRGVSPLHKRVKHKEQLAENQCAHWIIQNAGGSGVSQEGPNILGGAPAEDSINDSRIDKQRSEEKLEAMAIHPATAA